MGRRGCARGDLLSQEQGSDAKAPAGEALALGRCGWKLRPLTGQRLNIQTDHGRTTYRDRTRTHSPQQPAQGNGPPPTDTGPGGQPATCKSDHNLQQPVQEAKQEPVITGPEQPGLDQSRTASLILSLFPTEQQPQDLPDPEGAISSFPGQQHAWSLPFSWVKLSHPSACL